MVKQYYLGLDQGTTGDTALILNEDLELIAHGYREHKCYYPQPGYVEHDPVEVLHACKDAIAEAISKAGIEPSELACLGIDHEGESVVLWDKETGQPVYNALVWSDQRNVPYCESIMDKDPWFREKTGIMIDSYFSGTKIKWIIDNVDGVKEKLADGKILIGNLDAWLMWNFSGRQSMGTDHSTASRTLLYNMNEKKWDSEILDFFGIPEESLPVLGDSALIRGETDPFCFFGVSIPMAGTSTDQVAALFGQACVDVGGVKATYGTSGVMLMNTGNKMVRSDNGLLTTVAWALNGDITYALDGSFFTAGLTTQWLRDGLLLINSASETEAIATSVPDNGGLYFVPAFSGLVCPHWNSGARGTIIGITGGSTRAHLVRATLESTAYQFKDIFDAMQTDSGITINTMKADGGATKNGFLMQFQADLLNIPVEVPEIEEATALGAAYFALLGTGKYKDTGFIKEKWKLSRRYEPNMTQEKREELMYNWHRAVKRSLDWIEG